MQDKTTLLEGYLEPGSAKCAHCVHLCIFEYTTDYLIFILFPETLLNLHVRSIIFLDLSYR